MLSIQELIEEVSSVRQQSQQLAEVVGAANQELGQHSAQIAGLVQGSRTGQDALASRALADAGMSMTTLGRSCDDCVQNLRKQENRMRGVYVVDPQKQAAQNTALSRTRAEEQSVSQLVNEVRELVFRLDCAMGGAPSGIGRVLTGCCQQALSEFCAAQRCLISAAGEISSLEPGEWVPEEAVKGGWT